MLFEILGQAFKAHHDEATYVIDTFPIPVCDNIRIRRARRYEGEHYRGFTPSRRRYFYRKRIETVGSLLYRLMPKQIHAVTSKGFELQTLPLWLIVFLLYTTQLELKYQYSWKGILFYYES